MGKPKFLYLNDSQLVTALRQGNEAAVRYVIEDEAYDANLKKTYNNIIVKHRCRIKFKNLRMGFQFYMNHNHWEILKEYENEPSRLNVWLDLKANQYFTECGHEHDKKMAESMACLDEDKRKEREIDTEYVFKGKEYRSLFDLLHYKYIKSFNHQMERDEMIYNIYCHIGKDNYRKLKKYDSDKNFFDGWLYVTGKNFLVNYFTKKSESMNELIDDEDEVYDEAVDLLKDSDMAMDVRSVLPQLPDRYREVIIKSFYERMSPDDIAEKMGMTRKNVDTLKFRALAKLAQLLIDYNSEFGTKGTKDRLKKK